MKWEDEADAAMAAFADGNGYGDPDARRNDELKMQFALAKAQHKIAERLNRVTVVLVAVGLIQAIAGLAQVAILAFQVWRK